MVVGWDYESEGAQDTDLDALETLRPAADGLPRVSPPTERRRAGTQHVLRPWRRERERVNEFLSVRQIREELTRYGDRLPARLMPIAYAEGGNLVLLALDDGRVSFWDHELEDSNPVFILAPGFHAFWEALRPFDPSTVELKPGQSRARGSTPSC